MTKALYLRDVEVAEIFGVSRNTIRAWAKTNRLPEAGEYAYDSDRVAYENDDVVFDVTPDQNRDLQERIKKACDEWQTANGLVFKVCTFEDMRAEEVISIPKGINHD